MAVSSSDVRRLFLQSMLSRKLVSFEIAMKLWEKCIAAVKAADETLDIRFDGRRESWDAWITEINDGLNSLNLEVVRGMDEISGKEMFCLINRQSDEPSQLGTEYTPAEIAYFKNIVEQIVLAPNESYSISSFAALREVSSIKSNMTKTQAEVVLGSFVARGWLLRSKRGRYSLATRTTVELSRYLSSEYPDELLDCTICSSVVTRGIACATPHCKARLHDQCHIKYRDTRTRQGTAFTCPTCSESWQGERKTRPVGEAAFRDGQDKHRRRARRTEDAEGDEDEDSGEEVDIDASASQEPSQSQSQSQPERSQRTRKGKTRTVVSDEDEGMEEEEDVKPAKRKARQ